MLKKRIDSVSLFKFLAILLIIIGHIPDISKSFNNYIHSFSMPIFFMIYGFIKYDYNMYAEKDFYKNVDSKFRTLLVPYFVWAFIYSGISTSSIKGIFYGSHISLKEVSNSSLWFLPTYFIAVLLFDFYSSLLLKLHLKKALIVDVGVGVISFSIGYFIPYYRFGIPWGIDIAFISLSLMLIGKYIRILFNKIIECKIPLIIGYLLLSFLGTFSYLINSIDYMLMAEKRVGNPLIFIIVSIFGFVFIMMISILLERIKFSKLKKYFIYIGNNTMIFFVLQKTIIGFTRKGLSFINIIPAHISNVLVLILTTIILSICATFFNIYIPELNGKKNGN